MKLKEVLNVFKQKDLATEEPTLQRDFEFLRGYLSAMFPSSTQINLLRSKINFSEDNNANKIIDSGSNKIRSNNIYTEEYLPFHTRDNVWLANYLAKLIKDLSKEDKKIKKVMSSIDKKAKNSYPTYKFDFNANDKVVVLLDREENPKIKFAHIQKFVETNSEFARARNNYEENLVRAQIQFMMHNNETDEILVDNPNSKSKLCTDKVFRKNIIDTMKKLGISQFSIEASLEKNANLWFKKTATTAFYQQYKLIPYQKETQNDAVNWYSINLLREKFKPIWLCKYKYQYYIEHKDIIDALGLVTPDVKISKSDVQFLDETIAMLDLYYEQYIKQGNIQNDFENICNKNLKNIYDDDITKL